MTECAILFADLVGYARLTQRDEAGTLAYMEARFAEARASAAMTSGEIVKTTGDGFVALFPLVPAALDFALAFQQARAAEPDHRQFRIGVHFGAVRRETDDVYGHAVNVAARLEGLARPGGILISQAAFRRTGDAAGRFLARGPAVMKNINERMPVYEVADAGADAMAQSVAVVQVVDGVSLWREGGARARLRSPRALALLAVLGLSAPQERLRAECAALMGPEGSAGGQVFERTRRSLARAFERLGVPDAVQVDTASIRLHPGRVRVDIADMLTRARAGQVDDRLVRGIDWDRGLCPGLDDLSPTARGWVQVMRERWRREAVAALEASLDRFSPEEEGARRAGRALIRIEPGHEPAARKIIRHHAAGGNRTAALAEYERLRDWLGGRFSISPGPETEGLIAEVRSDRVSTGTAAAARAATSRPDLRIGAFVADPALADLAAGLRGDVVAALSRFREWTVTEEAEAEPGGDYRLSGRVRTSGAELTLASIATGAVLWRERLSAGGDRTQMQWSLVAMISARMEVYISADRISRAFAQEGAVRGFDRWIRTEGLLGRWTSEAEAEATGELEALIAREPGFAPAYASLAGIHNVRHIVQPGLAPDAESGARALRLARRAVELDPLDARSQLALAWAAALTGRFDQALVHLDLAATLNPTSPRTCISAAMGFAFFGEPARATALLDRTIGTAPLLAPWQWCYAVPVRYLAGDLDAAATAAARGGDAIPDNQGWRAVILAEQGEDAPAGAAFAMFARAIAGVWRGAAPPDAAALIRWFTHAYPIRRKADRERLAAALARAAAAVSGSA